MPLTNDKTWDFPSSSSSNTWTVLYRDGKLSCNCPGWTRRVALDGSRHCKHLDNSTVQHYVNTMNGTIDPNKANGAGVYKCAQCIMVFKSARDLSAHTNAAHNTSTITCAVCNGAFSDQYAYTIHLSMSNCGTTMQQRVVKARRQGRAVDPLTGDEDEPVLVRSGENTMTRIAAPKYKPLMLAGEIPSDMTIDHYDPEQWVIEQKFDGERVLVSVRNGKVFAWSRAQRDNPEGKKRTLPDHINAVLATLGDGDYDSEIVVGANGRSNDVRRIGNGGSSTLVIFDALALGGTDITDLSYTERRRRLAVFTRDLKADGPVIVATAMEPDSEVYDAIVAQGGEGVMLKRMSSKYVGRRSDDWLKVKARSEAVVTITGFEAGESGPHSVILFDMPSGVGSRCKNKNNDWLRRSASGSIAKGMQMEIEYQVLMESGKPRHPMAKRVLSPTETIE